MTTHVYHFQAMTTHVYHTYAMTTHVYHDIVMTLHKYTQTVHTEIHCIMLGDEINGRSAFTTQRCLQQSVT